MRRDFFVTGTDTGVGKTVVTAAIARLWRDEGRLFRVMKPVATGVADTAELAEAAGDPDLAGITPWRFDAPAAPPVAARLAGVSLSLEEIARAVVRRATLADALLIEGVGGLLCPLAEMATVADLIAALDVPVLAETCAQYLVLDDSVFDREDGHLFACCPQLKKPADSARLWRGLADGEVSVVSTDTCTFTREQKAMWEGDWTKIPMGMPGLETLLPLTYTHGVLGGRISIEEMSMKLSTNPARIMGLAPRKGSIAIGADADLAIIHPTRTHKVDPSTMETNADWSPFEGWDLAGFSRTTLSRGEVIVDDYRVVGREGRGKWLGRKPGLGTRDWGLGENAASGARTNGGDESPVPSPQSPVPAAV